ncbi:serine hydrolase domain-containing protein [Staphylococcus chromogenes]|nr:serine hydrolase domain-containing protein [Staphylococcus chromogenes]
MKKTFALILGFLATISLVVTGPQRVATAQSQTGDPALAHFLQSHAPRGSHNLAAFHLDSSGTTFAGLGADKDTEFEIGSITKTFNAELLRQAIERGEVRLDTKVKEIVDTGEAPIGDVRLEELANHTSGLPRNPGLDPLTLVWEVNPYAKVSDENILAMSKRSKLQKRGERNYSNLGAALLGQLLAIKAGRAWPDMVQKDILDPLGMTQTFVATIDTTKQSPHGLNNKGQRAANWEMQGYAPAGAIRSTASDMEKFAKHVQSTGLPGYAWVHDEVATWHNGATGGYASMLAFSPDGKAAAFVVTDSSARVTKLGKEMLKWSK